MKITEVEAIYLRIPDLDAGKCDGTQDTLIIRRGAGERKTGVSTVAEWEGKRIS